MKAVFTTKPTSAYDDVIEEKYHFPKTYLNQVEASIGDFIVYYEPRRVSMKDSLIGGRQSYFAVAQVDHISKDSGRDGLYYAQLSNYLDFDQNVPFSLGGKYFENSLQKFDGSTNKGAFGRAVRLIGEQEFDEILQAGFSSFLLEDKLDLANSPEGFAEPESTFKRPIVEMTTRRAFRDQAFSHLVRSAYDRRCAITGLRIINGGGRPEVQAAHIRPVAANGPDSLRNGLALSGTIHWMFDRGLISIADDYRILTVDRSIPEEIRKIVNSGGLLNMPDDESRWPHPSFIKFHRENIFKGAAAP